MQGSGGSSPGSAHGYYQFFGFPDCDYLKEVRSLSKPTVGCYCASSVGQKGAVPGQVCSVGGIHR